MGVGIITENRKEEEWSGDHSECACLMSSPATRKGIVKINGKKASEYKQ